MEKKLSIIVPCYKVEKYLSRCLESLLNQTLDDMEIICVNDGSPDNSIGIIRKYKEKYPEKIVIIDKENEGVWKARRDGIQIAKGTYIGFVDADDYVSENFAEKLCLAIERADADIAVCGFERIDMETNKVYSREMCQVRKDIDMEKNPEKVLCVNTAQWNKIYKRNLLKNMNDLKNPPQILEDVLFLLMTYVKTKKITFVNEALYKYMVRMDSAMSTVRQEQINSVYENMKEVRSMYEKGASQYLQMIDVMAFLHLGISLMFRLSYDKNCNLKEKIAINIKFLDEYFPNWRYSKYLKISYMLKNGFENLKLWIVLWVYKLHAFKLFISIYSFMINNLKLDIKW